MIIVINKLFTCVQFTVNVTEIIGVTVAYLSYKPGPMDQILCFGMFVRGILQTCHDLYCIELLYLYYRIGGKNDLKKGGM